MLIEWMMNLGETIFDALFALVGALPALPSEIRTSVDTIFNLMFSGVSLASIFIDLHMVKILIPIEIAVLNFDHIIKLVMFILKKIPLIDIH